MAEMVDIMKKVKGVIQYKHISEIISQMNNVSYAIVKGAPLSYYAYGDYGRRSFVDTDLLVDRKNVTAVEKILLAHGFKQVIDEDNFERVDRKTRTFCMSNSHQLLPYYKIINNQRICFDINFDIFWGEYEGKRISVEEFLSDATEMEIYGIQVKTLPPIKALIHLALHHYKDMNSIYLLATRKSIKYEMFQDVYCLLKNNLASISIGKLCSMSMEYDIFPYMFYILYYTGQVYEDEWLKKYIEAFRTPEGERLLNCYGLCTKERKEWKYDFKTRLETDDLYGFIRNDLSENDLQKININKYIFSLS